MSILTVTEYASGATLQVGGLGMQAPHEPPLVEQAIAIGGSSTQSAVFNAQTTIVRVANDATGPCAVTFGLNPTATTPSGGIGSQRLGPNQSQWHSVSKSQGFRLAVIATS